MYETIPCPDCNFPTRLVSVVPSLEPDIDEVTCYCAACDKEFTRSFKASLVEEPQ